MKKIIAICLIATVGFGNVKMFSVTHGDTTKYQSFHENGKLKLEGIKVKKYRDGLWKHYDKSGRMIKAEMYDKGFITDTLNMSEAK
tara:strand:- start:606 stop:863 length:258 start_codon:yes stop_codon:yes gene_type:complete